MYYSKPVEVLGLFFLHIVEKRELPCLWIVPTRRGAELHAIICREGYAEGVVAALGRRQDTEFGVTCSRWVLAFFDVVRTAMALRGTVLTLVSNGRCAPSCAQTRITSLCPKHPGFLAGVCDDCLNIGILIMSCSNIT